MSVAKVLEKDGSPRECSIGTRKVGMIEPIPLGGHEPLGANCPDATKAFPLLHKCIARAPGLFQR